jgi:hypothetical protein
MLWFYMKLISGNQRGSAPFDFLIKYKYKLLNFQNLLKVYFNVCVVLFLTPARLYRYNR